MLEAILVMLLLIVIAVFALALIFMSVIIADTIADIIIRRK